MKKETKKEKEVEPQQQCTECKCDQAPQPTNIDNALVAMARGIGELASAQATANQIALEDLKTKDRVNISLTEYINLKNEIARLTNDNGSLRRMLAEQDAPPKKQK